MKNSQEVRRQITKLEEKRLELKQEERKILPYFLIVPLAFILSILISQSLGPAFLFTFFVALVIWMGFHYSITLPFKALKINLREALLQSFMSKYHPKIRYEYHAGRQKVKDIVENSGLISANVFKEEDVIEGKMNHSQFYLSEIHLKKKLNKSQYTVFKGILFRLKIPGKNYPKSQIQSKPGLLMKMFGSLLRVEPYDFFYDSVDPIRFQNELNHLFPFFNHLMKKNTDVRIKIEGDEIVLLLESDIQFLDEPKPTINSSFDNKEYYNKLAQHLNSFLFIIESISSGADTLQLEQKLKSKFEKLILIEKLKH